MKATTLPQTRSNLPAVVNVLRWTMWETFRQASASRIGMVMGTVTLIALVFCAGIRVHGGHVERSPREILEFAPRDLELDEEQKQRAGVVFIEGEISFGFGLVRVAHARSAEDSVRFVQLILAVAVAGTFGLLLALVWTAGFVPGFLEPQQATVLFTKPVPPGLLLAGKYLGTTAYVGVQAALFVGGTWLALGLATGVWLEAYWLAVPILILQFAVFFAVSVLLAVLTRSTTACLVGTVAFWFLCSAVNSHAIEQMVEGTGGGWSAASWQVGYWLLPKPLDLYVLFSRTLQADSYLTTWPALQRFGSRADLTLEWSVLSSMFFAVGLWAISSVLLRRASY